MKDFAKWNKGRRLRLGTAGGKAQPGRGSDVFGDGGPSSWSTDGCGCCGRGQVGFVSHVGSVQKAVFRARGDGLTRPHCVKWLIV